MQLRAWMIFSTCLIGTLNCITITQKKKINKMTVHYPQFVRCAYHGEHYYIPNDLYCLPQKWHQVSCTTTETVKILSLFFLLLVLSYLNVGISLFVSCKYSLSTFHLSYIHFLSCFQDFCTSFYIVWLTSWNKPLF